MNEIGDYVYNDKNILGKGSFSLVYLGESLKNNEKIAIKKIYINPKKKDFYDIKNEINILQKLNHPNIVLLKNKIILEKDLYIILEYCPLGDLNSFFNKKMVKEEYVKHYAIQIISGLKYLALNNIMHRDIKPHNILLKNIYNVKISDFGFAKYYDKFDLSKTLCGSPIYMAPEIMQFKSYNYKTDIWSLGILLYELLYGTPPFIARNHIELIHTINSQKVVYSYKNPISKECISFLENLLQKNEKLRPDYPIIEQHDWIKKNNKIEILNLSSTYQIYNRFIINEETLENIESNSSSEEIFKFDEDYNSSINKNLHTVNLEDTQPKMDKSDISDDYIILDNPYDIDTKDNMSKTEILKYSLSNIYQKIVHDYF